MMSRLRIVVNWFGRISVFKEVAIRLEKADAERRNRGRRESVTKG